MRDDEIKTLQQLIRSFNLGYYDAEIREIEKQIDNIEIGNPIYKGIHSSYQGPVLVGNEKTKNIKLLKGKIKDLKDQRKKAGLVLGELKSITDRLENICNKDHLLNEFRKDLMYDYKAINRKTEIYEKNKKKYKKIFFKSTFKITIKELKISQKLYKKIKKNLKLDVYKYESRYDFEDKPNNYFSIKTGLKNHQKQIDSAGSVWGYIMGGVRREYERRPFSFMTEKKVEEAKERLQGEISDVALNWQGYNASKKLENIKRIREESLKTSGGRIRLDGVEERYRKILEISKELWYVGEILEAYKDTSISNTETYKSVMELAKEQERELTKLTRETDEIYKGTRIDFKIEILVGLEKLYSELESCKYIIEQEKSKGTYNKDSESQKHYDSLQYEIIKILKDNPDFDDKKYGIDVKEIRRKEMKFFESIIKSFSKEEKANVKTNDGIENEEINEIKLEESTHIEKKSSQMNDVVEVEEKKKESKLPKIIDEFQQDDSLITTRSFHYRNYIMEQVNGNPIGLIPFSEYLETVRPDLTRLINVEKERENLARTIYAEYLLYYASLGDNKSGAMKFHDYADRHYGVYAIDIPIEEELKGMNKKWIL